MNRPSRKTASPGNDLGAELKNFQENAKQIIPSPGEIPKLDGLDIAGATIPYQGEVGGDHIIFVDFNRRFNLKERSSRARKRGKPHLAEILTDNQNHGAVLIADVSGHRITDAMLTGMLHQAFLIGLDYELETNGRVTVELFSKMNHRFFHSSAVNKFATMLYGEISKAGKFRFISAGHPHPYIFSQKQGRLLKIPEDHIKSQPPIGLMPSNYEDEPQDQPPLGKINAFGVSEIQLMGEGDFLLIFSDGLIESFDWDLTNVPCPFQKIVGQVKDKSSNEILHHIFDEVQKQNTVADDMSCIVIKKTSAS